jgi:hypothetical protein
MSYKYPNNECGGCTACCTVLPICDEEMLKQAGTTCEHCTGSGCGIYDTRPQLCRDYLCGWRRDEWLGSRPDYRPDRLGVMFNFTETHRGGSALGIWEVNPGALNDPRLRYIVSKINSRYQNDPLIRRYPLHVLDNEKMDLQYLEGAEYQNPYQTYHFRQLGPKDYIAEPGAPGLEQAS